MKSDRMARWKNTRAPKKILLDRFGIREQPAPAFLLGKIGYDDRVKLAFKHARRQRSFSRNDIESRPRRQRQLELVFPWHDPVNILCLDAIFIAENPTRPESARVQPARDADF